MRRLRIPSSGSKRSPVSIISESFRHAGLSPIGSGSVPTAGSRFQRFTMNAFGFSQSRISFHAMAAISNSADHNSGGFHSQSFTTKADSSTPQQSTATKNFQQDSPPNDSPSGVSMNTDLTFHRSGTGPAGRRAGRVPSLPIRSIHAPLPGSRGWL